MTFWIDAQLSPALPLWLQATFSVNAYSLRDLGLRDADDFDIFKAAREADAVVITKDHDFVEIHRRLGAPPSIIWLTCGNTSNARLKQLMQHAFPDILKMLERGETFVEITDRW